MSDQVPEQSPQSRLEAMLGDSIVTDVKPTEVQEEEREQPPLEAEAEAETTDEVETEEATDEEPETETEEEEQSEEDEVPAILKLKVNGEEVEKPLDEVVALAQQGLDYTQKTQQVAEQRKELEAYAEQIKMQEQAFQEQVQLNNVLIEDVAKITALDQQLNQYANVNWQELSDSDFVEAQIERLAKAEVKSLSLTSSDESLRDRYDALRDKAATLGLTLKFDLPVPYSVSNPVVYEARENTIPEGAGKAWLYVEPDGDVLPTQGSAEKILGNLLQDEWTKLYKEEG